MMLTQCSSSDRHTINGVKGEVHFEHQEQGEIYPIYGRSKKRQPV